MKNQRGIVAFCQAVWVILVAFAYEPDVVLFYELNLFFGIYDE